LFLHLTVDRFTQAVQHEKARSIYFINYFNLNLRAKNCVNRLQFNPEFLQLIPIIGI
jgi:hypothetical protein